MIAQIALLVEDLGFEVGMALEQRYERVADGRFGREIDVDTALAGGFREVRKEFPLHTPTRPPAGKNPFGDRLSGVRLGS